MLGRAWQALMKEIDGLIACSHYGVIEWLCTYDQTINADVARKRSARRSRGGDMCSPPTPLTDVAWGEQSPWPWGTPSIPEVRAVLVSQGHIQH